MQDIAVGRIARALRHRLRLRQVDVAARADMSQGLVSLVERGRLDRISLRRLRRLFAEYDAEVVVSIRWRGGAVDRLTDAAHAALGEALTRVLREEGWEVVPEVSYSVFGERGSIDLLAWHPASRTLLVVELKTEIGAVEATLRQHDVKVRLGPEIARKRFGWDVRSVGRLLVLPEERTPRRQVARHANLFERAYRLRTVAVRRWLAAPIGPMSGLMFLTATTRGRARRGPLAPKRIVAPRAGLPVSELRRPTRR
jgi:transcriptional regulator with XRE-family HTH domain